MGEVRIFSGGRGYFFLKGRFPGGDAREVGFVCALVLVLGAGRRGCALPVSNSEHPCRMEVVVMPKVSKSSPVVVEDVDTLTVEEIAERLEKTRGYVVAIRGLWPGLVKLEEKERKTSVGRNVAQLGKPLRDLFTLLLPRDGKVPAIAKVFDVLGDQDDGDDPEQFEAGLLLRRLDRAEAENEVVTELEALTRDIADDVLATGQSVVLPGLLALNLARSVAKGNATFRSELRTVLDGLRDLTKRARKSQAADRQSPAAGTPPAPNGNP